MSSIDSGTNLPKAKQNGFEMRINISEHLPDGMEPGAERALTNEEEDALLRESTASFADWIANLIRRVILLLENLPEEDANGSQSSGEEGKQIFHAESCSIVLNAFSGGG